MNHILRDVKLSKLTNTPMGEDTTKFIKFWDELWINMKVHVDPKKGKIRCWKEGYDYYYFTQNDNGILWCNHYKVWTFFGEELGLNNNDTQELIQYMIGDILNCERTLIVSHYYNKDVSMLEDYWGASCKVNNR